ncbi:class I SAM-dependent methyltransferase [Lagierella sp.]|uniref:tRNA (adenine(22)-N(1))-methyltransferase n=1 Tax=Lagierella sp. TaxID=2849657 RepID=UPI00261BE9C9|nr:class I SAM-dependent methyltransferase [Lagierella sp.]
MSQDRLQEIVDFVDNNSIVADIGTDHGLVPIYLSKNKVSKKIIGVDISEKSLYKLQSKIENNYVYDNIETRVSDGLKALKPFEVDTIIISGMGGILISKIISESISIAKSANTLILQGNNNIEHLRKFLHENGFVIVDESDVYEKDKYYQILKVKCGLEVYDNDLEYEFGRILINKGSKNLLTYLKRNIEKIDIIIDEIRTLSHEESTDKLELLSRRKESLVSVVKEVEDNRPNK